MRRDGFDLLGGISFRRFQFATPAGAPVPNTLQSIAGVVGWQSRFADYRRAKIEALPGIYSDFNDVSGSDFNVPVILETAHELNPRVELGAQVMVNPFRKNLAIGTLGIT